MHEHDKIAQRLGMLLTRLYSGEKLHLHELAAEYNVTLRTLQRDFNERLSYLPIENRNRECKKICVTGILTNLLKGQQNAIIRRTHRPTAGGLLQP